MPLTIYEAWQHFLQSDTFKEIAKKQDSEGKRLTGAKSRWKDNKLGEKAMFEILTKYGYDVEVIPPEEKPKKKKK